MPRQAEWLLRVPEIRTTLAHIDLPVVDRGAIEKAFGVKRRRAIQLMHELGGYQAGRTFLLDRLQLLHHLDEVEKTDRYQAEQRRHQRLRSSIDQAREDLAATRIVIPVRAGVATINMAGLGSDVRLRHGVLTEEFGQLVDLLEKLYVLAQAIARDFETFETMSKGKSL